MVDVPKAVEPPEWVNREAKEFFKYLILKGRAKGTAYQNARYIHHFLEYVKKDPREVTRDDVMKYITSLLEEKKYDEATVRNIARSLSSFFKYLGRDDIAKWIPIPVPKHKEVQWLPEDIIMKIVKDDVYLRIAYELALRVSELLMLKVNEYDPKTGMIAVYREKHKGKPNRYLLKLSDEAREMLNQYLQTRTCKDDRIFCISTRAIQGRFKRRLKWAGLDPKKYTFHLLRHSRATNLCIKMLKEKGYVDLVTLAKFMGHLDPRTTMMYIHIASKTVGAETPIIL
jgi:integrase/recombinase XerD